MAPFTLRLLLSLATGLAAGVHAAPATTEPVHAALALSLMILALAHAHRRERAREALAWLAAACVSWLLGLHAVDRALHPPLRTLLEQSTGGFAIDSPADGRLDVPIFAEGTLLQDAAAGATGIVLRMAVERIWLHQHPQPATGGVSIVVSGALAGARQGEWSSGRRIRAPLLLRRPARYLNDGVPDLERALARRRVALVGTIKSGALVEVIARASWFDEAAARLRARVRRVLAARLSAGPTGAAPVATAILLGDRASLDSGVERRLQEAGTYHVLAISGGNIAIFAGAVLGAMAFAGWRGRAAAVVAIIVLAAYGVIVEGGPSVVRATSMAVLYLALRLIDQRTAPVNALALVVIGVLMADPLAVVDVGLWLTCGATLGILLGAQRMNAAPIRAARWLVVLLMATLAAEAMLLPVSALVFERVTMAGIGLNVVAIPCMTAVQLGAMSLVGFDAIAIDAAVAIAARVTEWGVAGLLGSAAVVDYAPWLTWRVPAPSALAVAGYYAALTAWWLASAGVVDTVARRRLARTAGFMAVSLAGWIAVHPASLVRAAGDGQLRVTMIDVGQGDCVLVTFPDGRRLLVDAGGGAAQGSFDIGERVVGPALRARGVRRLDYLAITHADPDHVGGGLAVLRDFEPREIWYGVPVPGHPVTEALRAEADRRRLAWRTLQRGDRIESGEVQVRVLHPPLPDWERRKVRNDDSLVLSIRYRDAAVLLTGDVGGEVEQALLEDAVPGTTTVLKVPHHGSTTSSSQAFVAAFAPIAAIVGVGRGNSYGHPAAPVLERYAVAGTAMFRTDQDGEIDLATDGARVDVRTFSGRRWSR